MKKLVVLMGPTAVGKTELSLCLAEVLHCPIISADSRQVYKEMRIGTAAPTEQELKRVKHFFIGSHSVEENYSAGQYEQEALSVIEKLFEQHDTLLLVGGSMMYIDAVCKGFDEMPSIDPEIRHQVREDFKNKGIEYLQEELKKRDPDFYEKIDLCNHQRLMRAIEVCRQTNMPFSELRKGKVAERPFQIEKIGLDLPRAELYSRINKRVDQMLEEGLLEEAKTLYKYKGLNALNTVGYKELFAYMDGEYDFEEAVRLIKQDSRHYAKRQLTWFRADKDVRWFNADSVKIDEIIQCIS
ncbi:MAG: tRNA (adenosine(37)-N6)-dimethylallyltransferase MiaA [Paludibacteraceae bacterium]|nr:tRNA (adenosine(37)-N6)-dimethylallyltransferase MiaA [Paludibacteraceae bacterium]